MPRIRCHYADCVFVDDGVCSAAAVEFDPEEGCKTYSPSEESAGEDWDEEEELDEWGEEESDEDDELWEEDEDEF